MPINLARESETEIGLLTSLAWRAGDWDFCAEAICELAARRWHHAVDGLPRIGRTAAWVGPRAKPQADSTALGRLRADLRDLPTALVANAVREFPGVDAAALRQDIEALIPRAADDLDDPRFLLRGH